MQGIWLGLLSNMAIVAALLSAWASARDAVRRWAPRLEATLFGLAMSVGAILAIVLAFPLEPGARLDLRAAPLVAAGFFGGPLAAVVAAIPPFLYRLSLGGSGMPPGLVAIVAVAGLGAFLHMERGDRPIRMSDAVWIALLTAVVHLSSFLAMPFDTMGRAFLDVGVPTVLFDTVGVSLAILSLIAEDRRRSLASANLLFRAVTEALPDSLSVKDVHGRFVAANTATARLMGAENGAALLGRTDADFYPDDEVRRFREDERATLATGEERLIEQRIDWPGQPTIWLSTLKVPMRAPDGTITGVITHNRDITAAKTLQLELLQVRQHLSDALETMADGLVLHDRDGRVIVSNKQYRSMFPRTGSQRLPGTMLRDALRAALATGEQIPPPGVTPDAWIEGILAELHHHATRTVEMADGRWLEIRTRPVADGGSLAIFADVTARKLEEQALRHRADHDALTGLANRATFNRHLARLLADAKARSGTLALLLIDLDDFKAVNDNFGHAVGDRLLVEVAQRLQLCVRPGDVVARLGGDEFAILCPGGRRDSGSDRCAQRVVDTLGAPFVTGAIQLLPGGSVGLAEYPVDAHEAAALANNADKALYAAKRAGRRRWCGFSHLRPQAIAG